MSDFGIIKELDGMTGVDSSETFVGTLNYMSPERVFGKAYTSKADIWSLGLSLYGAFMGKSAIDPSAGYWGLNALFQNGSELNVDYSDCTEELKSFFMDMLQLDPEFRSSAKSLLLHPFIMSCHEEDGTPIIADDFELITLPEYKDLKRKFKRICKKLYYHYSRQARKEFKADRKFECPKFKAKHIKELGIIIIVFSSTIYIIN